VHLATTDPAAHLDDTLDGAVERITLTRIDPVQATREYRDRIMATRGKGLDEAGRANLAEDLLSPCTEEVAVFQQFSRLVLGARREFVVIDTAPTGHTLLLLDAAGSYHRDVARQMGEGMNYRTPLMVLRDPTETKVLLITLPEPTPVSEAHALQQDLQRAGITPWALGDQQLRGRRPPHLELPAAPGGCRDRADHPRRGRRRAGGAVAAARGRAHRRDPTGSPPDPVNPSARDGLLAGTFGPDPVIQDPPHFKHGWYKFH
jgi:hypothetical protein